MARKQARKTRFFKIAPVIKLRHVGAGVLVVATAITGPLLVVRKQVYLRDLAIRREQLSDTLAVNRRETASLAVEARQLSSLRRIETIARDQLNMDYPKSDQIKIVEGRKNTGGGRGFLALIKRSLGRDDS